MPAKVKARVLAARNLPVMDRSSETTDAFAEVEFKNSKFKTEVCRKSLNPTWPNTDWFRFDVDDCDLQDEPLQIRIMDYDIYSANDAIGKVYIDLNPLLLKADNNRDKQVMLSGWLPIFDTMHGVRGEVNVNVKVELFSDLNKFRASSCGVLFFCSSSPPSGYRTEIISFVEKLCVNDDPEYQWIDKIRTPRASNEARQALFMKLSSIVQRKIGSMALELGANAVLGYRQNFDLEGDSGIVARAIGTAVKVVKESPQFDLTKENIVSQKDSNYQVSRSSQGNNPGYSNNQKLESMFELNKTTTNIFQNLSNPWLISSELAELGQGSSPSPGASTTGLGLVSSLSAAFSKPLESFATVSAGPTSWLSRKSSFKAVAAKTIRSVSVTSMARSPITSHHRVASIKSAKAAFMRKNSSSDAPISMLQTSPTTSSIGTSVSQDMTELSMPSLELRNPSSVSSPRGAPASFWINNDDYDTDDDNLSSKMEVDSIQSELESNPDCFDFDDNKDFLTNQTDWAKAALQKRLDKGRVDSTTNTEVTFLNTIINQSLTVTDEGKEIRRKLIDEISGASPLILRNADCGGGQADSDHLRIPPPVLTIEPPSPLPYNAYHNATMASSQSPLSSAESDKGCPTKRLNYRRSTKSSHSFSSVRDRRYLRCNTNNSSSRSSSEPPGTIPVIPSRSSSKTNIDNSDDDSHDIDSNSTNLSSSHPSHRLLDNSKTSSRHASGESDNTTTGCSPKVSSALSFGVPPQQQQQKSKLSSKMSLGNEVEILEHPFLTLRVFPEGFIQRLGGLVCCRSVKLLDGDLQDNKHKALREAWWQEIRHEIRTHAMTLGCNLVVGYSEDTSIFEDIVVLSANGTAVTARLNPESLLSTMFGPLYTKSNGKSAQHGYGNANGAEDSSNSTCSMLHIPLHSSDFTLPFTWSKKNCHFCGAKNAFVPDVMFTTIEPPVDQLLMIGRGCVLQAKVIRLKKDLKGENNGKEISDALPFIEYEIHRQLINKLKVKGMNAIFGLKMTLTLSDRVMVATALGTGVYLAGLPAPSPPRLVHHRDDQEYLMRMQRRLEEKITENMNYHGITNEQVTNNRQLLQRQQRCSSSMEEDDTTNADNVDADVLNNAADYELTSQPSDHGDLLGNKDVCVLEIDDTEDSEILESILDRFPPPGIQVFSTEELIGISKGHIVKSNQLFTQIWRGKIQPTTKDLTKICQRLLSAIYFKLRKLKPCLVSNLTMKADVDEENEIQLTFTGIAIALAHDGKTRQELASELTHLEENSDKSQESESTAESASVPVEKTVTLNKMRSSNFYMESKAQEGIVLTPQSFVCGGRIEKYLGNLNFFLIRETSSLREAGGLSHFVQSFICEIQCIVRAHVMSLGGNALLSYFMSEFVIMHNPHKNQAQCLLHVGGDAVLVNYSPLM